MYRKYFSMIATIILGLFVAQFSIAQEINVANGTSFENGKAGEFAALESSVGTWNRINGQVLIDNKHAKTGSQCLQIAGDGATVELVIGDNLKTDGQLSFWAERWTKRVPFRFRIEKQSGGQWSEIYNGDQTVRVGRAFLSRVKVPLGDENISKLRFLLTSPVDTGVLIDDMRIAPAESMKVTAVEVVPLTLPALVGAEQSAILKLKVTTTGLLNPISIREVAASLVGESSEVSIENFQPFYSESETNFRWNEPFGKAQTTRQGAAHKFTGEQLLAEGDNYVWLACKLKDTANVDETIAARFESITFSNGESKVIGGDPSIQRLGVALRHRGDDGVHTYRIPGLATSNLGTLIGVYDVRHDKGGDLPGNIDVGLSRSTDGGRTWEPMRVIMDMGDDPGWRGDGIGDPGVLVDRKTGTIWVSATWSHGNRSWNGSGPGIQPEETGQWMLVKSDDDGVTWSEPINITSQVKKPEWSFLLQGPGKGITMSDGTIVFPAQYQDPPNENDKQANRLPHSTFIYSRDNGSTWKTAVGAWDDTTESQIVELSDGELMLNCRYNRASRRAVMTTTDMGQTWKEHSTHVKDLIEPRACMASLINVGRELAWRDIRSEFNDEFLLFSNPDSLRGRNHMTIKASKDSGMTWPMKHHLLLDEQGGAGYSCMTMIDAETVGILYEGSQAHMTFQRVKIKDILSPPENQKTKNPALSIKAPERLSVARVFGNDMVLQTHQSIRIWGKAKPASQVSVSFLEQTVSNIVDENGDWLVEMPPIKNYVRTGQTLTVSTDNESVKLENILVGEVWFCAGQSNMEWALSKTIGGPEAIDSVDDDQLRLLNFPGKARGSSGQYGEAQFKSLVPENFSSGIWELASPASSTSFSGVGYFFARKIRDELECPVGIINVAVGGTPIESWVSTDELADHPTLKKMLAGNWLENPELDQWCQGRARSNLQRGITGEFQMAGDEYGPNHSFKPGFMHPASVAQFQPMSFRGVLWYQGESNADNEKRIEQYQSAFPLMVNSWRREFLNPDMPWIFVQLPAMGRPNWPQFREQQRRSLDEIDNVGMAITMDVGHPTDVHPKNKRPIGERLAAWALVNTYGRKGVAMGPLLSGEVSFDDKATVEFNHIGDGLKTTDSDAPRHFELAGNDKIFHAATARIVKANQVEVISDDVPSPRFVRYGWAPFPDPPVNLVNSVDMPASPFSTDNESK